MASKEETLALTFIFFFQAEDGIRDLYVTGVQTCALPISAGSQSVAHGKQLESATPRGGRREGETRSGPRRSEERRVGKECRSRWSASPSKKKERTSAHAHVTMVCMRRNMWRQMNIIIRDE